VQGAHLHYLGSARVYSLATDMTFMLHTSHTTFYTTQAAERKQCAQYYGATRIKATTLVCVNQAD
jgi:hypothetical protein